MLVTYANYITLIKEQQNKVSNVNVKKNYYLLVIELVERMLTYKFKSNVPSTQMTIRYVGKFEIQVHLIFFESIRSRLMKD